ncbi:2-C-methyl-D-erythritol 2,4-cyclodiphosphate synthase [bacterium]|nr:2-C-methyl-D-erythritol 2,4-cyclodiphosphate synthase [bacterium]
MRVGEGFDVHKLVEGRQMILGGVKIDYHLGLDGHSDADVLTHSIIDALFGATALGDIGTHFPDSDQKYKNISSLTLLKLAIEKVELSGYKLINVDSTLMLEEPKVADYVQLMRGNLSKTLGINIDNVSVKATTTEGLGFTGRGEGVAAKAIVLLMIC